MAACLQIFSQFGMVIDLAVENNPDIAILIRQRLMAALYVNDAQPAHGEADILFDEESLVVRPAMDDAAVHLGEHIALHAPLAIREEDSADSTHIRILSPR